MSPPEPAARWRVLVIGIAAGEPGQLTGDAVAAMGQVEVFLAADKRSEVGELLALRRRLCDAVLGAGFRLVAVPDPERDAGPDRASYEAAVSDWHRARAAADVAAIRSELPSGGTVGYLVWGDPSLYDSTLRKVALIAELGLPITVEVFPGLSSPTLLAAAHQITLNRVGLPVHITTGRRLADDWAVVPGDVLVMLDGRDHLAALAERAPDAYVYWGALLGLSDQSLVAGRLGDVVGQIAAKRAALRAEHGWVMDTYLVRRP